MSLSVDIFGKCLVASLLSISLTFPHVQSQLILQSLSFCITILSRVQRSLDWRLKDLGPLDLGSRLRSVCFFFSDPPLSLAG